MLSTKTLKSTFKVNKTMEEEVSKAVVLATLLSMQKGKSLGCDRLTVEFFIGFYDHIKDDLLKVVRESHASMKVLSSLNSTFLALIPNNQDGTPLIAIGLYHVVQR
jgi:hypothetical protein